MKRCYFVLIIMLYTILPTGCSRQGNTMTENEILGQTIPISTSPVVDNNISEIDYPTSSVPVQEDRILEHEYKKMADFEVKYIPELGYHAIQIRDSNDLMIYICWKDTLIIGDTIYKKEGEIYQRTEERLQDWFNIEGDLNIYNFYQWENLLIVESKDEIMILDMDSGHLWIYPFDGFVRFVYQGKMYYKVSYQIHSMDLLSGEVEIIYASGNVSDFRIRDNGDIIISAISRENKTDLKTWEFWLLSYDEHGDLDSEKIWETDIYEYVEMLEFNNRGLFMIGEYYDAMGDGADLLCLKDNGEREEMVLEKGWSLVGEMIVEEGYFLWDSQMLSEEEKTEILGSWSWNRPREAETVVDSISFYDFQGNKLKTWQLIDDEMLEAGYRLKYIVYDNGEILAFYENEELDDLFINKVKTLY